jgi:hypothetical protein
MKQVMASLITVLINLISILYNSDPILLYAGNISPDRNYILYGHKEIRPTLLAILIRRSQRVYLAMRLPTRQKTFFL